jgi:2-oxoglutarate dehydrogenase E1 component
VIDDLSVNKNRIRKIILCSGKIFYDLESRRKIRGYEHIAIIRVEQFYPLDRELFSSILKSFPEEAEITWCQEEPKNMGGWTFMLPYVLELTGKMAKYVGRKCSASPAVGSLAIHKYEQSAIISEALDSE